MRKHFDGAKMKIDTKIYLDKFKPRDFQYQLFDAFENKKIRKLVCVWPRRCLAGDTQIIMANGSWKELKDVSVGDQILSWNGEGFEPDVVEDSWKTGEKETVLIKSPNALPLTSSLDHKFAYLKTTGKTLGKCGNNEIIVKSAEWSKAKDVRFKRVLTYSGSEGNVNDPVLAKQMGTVTDVHKSLPSRVWDFDRESLLSFMGALFSKIGSFKSELKMDHYCSCFELRGSLFKNFIFDIFWVFKKLQLHTKKPTISRDFIWVLRIIDESTVEFLAENLDFQNSKITEALAPYIRRMDGLFKPVVKKVFGCIAAKPGKPEKSGRMRLYDIRTRKNHNFIANGFVVHNSGKDICAFNLVIREALRTVGVYYYIFPSYSQARKVIWDSLTNDGQRFLDFIPPKLVSKTNSQEMKVTLENGSLIQLIGSDNIDCFDEKTEILSEDGWKLFKDLSKDERVATLVDGQLKYNVPTEHMEYGYSGDMYRISSKSIDMFVTPNHRFYVRSSKGFYKFKDISDPTIRHDSIPAKSSWKGEERETFHFPSVSRGSVYSSRGLDKRSLPMEDFVALLGIYLSEGCTFQNKENNRITITQQKPINKIKIANLLVRCNIKFSERKGNFNFNCRLMHSYFSQFGLQHKRYIPKGIKSLSPRYLKILLDWLVLGDGYKNDNNIGYYSTSKRLVDDIQEIVIKLGLSANITEKKQSVSMIRGRVVKPTKILYDLLIRTSCFKRLSSSNKNYISKESYIGKVYCVSVPSGVIKVRRNGKECWSGNSIVGSNPRGCVFSEYAIQDPRAYQFIRPILAANKGWALFVSTPRGKNHFWELYNIALRSEAWYCSKLTLEDTEHIDMEEIELERRDGLMSEDLIQQEYYTSFTMGVEGAYYAKYIDKMRVNNQIGNVPWEVGFKVHTAWDIGVRDSTTILFFQTIGQTVRIIDSYEKSKEGLEHYVNIINSKPYTYGKHIAPHDIRVKEFGSGMTRITKARNLGLNFTIANNISIVDGIESVRSAFSKIWIDQTNCKGFLKAIENYRQEYDHKRRVYKATALHDWSSHFADCLRYLCISLPKTRDGLSPEELNKRYLEALYGEESTMPAIFRDKNSRY